MPKNIAAVRKPGGTCVYTYHLGFWEEGSRPGRMKLDLVWRTETLIAKSDEDAKARLQRRFAYLESIAYSQSSIAKLKWQDATGKDWEITNETYKEWDRFSLGIERPAFYARLAPSQQRVVGALDRMSPQLAYDVALQLKRASEHLM